MAFKIDVLRTKVRVHPKGNFRNSITDDEASKITDWVKETATGRRIAFNIWLLNDKAAVSLFILRWAS